MALSEWKGTTVGFWDALWLVIISFFFIAYLIALFSIVMDVFRDHELGGLSKAIWLLLLMVFPLLTALIYLIARGDGMAKRSAASAKAHQDATDAYIRDVAGTSPADEIAKAKSLLDAGTITEDEFAAMKAKALA